MQSILDDGDRIMGNLCFRTEIIGEDDKLLSTKLFALNSEVRFTILKILRDYEKVNRFKNKEPLYSREINSLLTNFNINITPQMLGQHLKILVEADLLEEMMIKKEIPNKIGHRRVKAYVIKPDAFSDLFLEINFFSEELLSFFDMYDIHQKFHNGDDLILTVFNGANKRKTFKIDKGGSVIIGRRDKYSHDDFDEMCILLDNSYRSVSSVSKPHLKLFYEDGCWYVLDSQSSNGTFIGDKKIPKGVKFQLTKNSFLKLSRGGNNAVIYVSF